ncbi:MAG: ribonuclease R [Oscillospiraceae bacterium]
MNQDDIYRTRILGKIKAAGKNPLPFQTLLRESRGSGFEFARFTAAVTALKRSGEIYETDQGFLLPDKDSYVHGTVVKLAKTFGFVKNTDTGEDIFVSGRFLKGAMPGDLVTLRTFKGRGESPEGEVMSVDEENFTKFTGVIVFEFGALKIMPDTLSKFAMSFTNPGHIDLREGDKVMAAVTKRGMRHSDHKCEILSSFGSSLKASVCAMSVLEVNGLTPVFPFPVVDEARRVSAKGIAGDMAGRVDLRGEPIFTIDGADTKDIDDAVCVFRTEDGYELGVHIADVSHYVTPKSALDDEAFTRGTSVYYANRVIPMLPEELSNGICSLNPQEDRLVFSVKINLDKSGTIKSYKFFKSVIRSRVKGVYSELNSILAGELTPALAEKYAEVLDSIPLMKELAEVLKRSRVGRGAPQLSSTESKLVLDENDVCVGVIPRKSGRSEELIEDFMLMANTCAARFGTENALPFVYRIHEDPPEEKVNGMTNGLLSLGVNYQPKATWSATDFSAILASVKDTPLEIPVNTLVLRSMAKAKYSPEPVGHFGLVLKDYAHFTSPIRRFPDLTIHRIMSDFLAGKSIDDCETRYRKFVCASAEMSTRTEITAMTVERTCEDLYKAEYMKSHLGDVFEGVVMSVMEFGMFIELPDTCEGLLRVDDLPAGEYAYDGMTKLKNLNTGITYQVGNRVKVQVAKADVSAGKVDFVPADEFLLA